MTRRDRRLGAVVAVLAAALFAVFVVGLSPHLVHHLFDERAAPECPFAALAERQHAVPVVAVVLVLVAAAHAATVLPGAPALSVARAPSTARAPPLSAS